MTAAAPEQAGIWLRVSTAAQDEANQEPDVLAWCQQNGYRVAKRYVVHGKSASKGRHEADLSQALADMRAGVITVLVVWAADRIERRGALPHMLLAEEARQAGGRIEYVKDAYLNSTNDMSDVMLSLAATQAKLESKRKSERTIADHNARRARNSLIGRPPWGYAIELLPDGRKTLAPTEDCARLAPGLWGMIADGQSLTDAANWLNGQGVLSPTGKQWSTRSVREVILNTTYAGRRRRVKDGTTDLRVQPVIGMDLYQSAKAALSDRNTGKSGRRPAADPSLVRYLKCDAPGCDASNSDSEHRSPMYRIGAGNTLRYRCTGNAPGVRRGCGNNIPAEDLESAVTHRMLMTELADYEDITVEAGHDHSAAIAELREDLAELDLTTDEGWQRAGELRAEVKRLEKEPAVKPKVRRRTLTMLNQDGEEVTMSVGDHYAGLDRAGRREYLAEHYYVAAHLDPTGRVELDLVRKDAPAAL